MKKWIVLLVLMAWCVPAWADPHTGLNAYGLKTTVSNEIFTFPTITGPGNPPKDITYWDTNQEIRLFRIEQTLKQQQEKIEELQKQIYDLHKLLPTYQFKNGEWEILSVP
jgi:hypothetical protein